MRFVGTRTGFGSSVGGAIEAMLEAAPGEVCAIAITSAYWDAEAVPFATRLAERARVPVQLLLWTAGATKAAWRAARASANHDSLDLRFVDSPGEGGIFHAKVAAAVGADAAWTCALIGSANLTQAGLHRNVEVGVIVRASDTPLHQLQAWFDDAFAEATPAGAIDWDTAIKLAADRSEAAARNETFRRAALATPMPAPGFEPPALPG